MMLLILIALVSIAVGLSAPLDDYVWRADDNYKWVELPEHRISGTGFGGKSWTGYTLNMTSQQWLTDADFAPESDSKSIWWHFLVVIVPNEVLYTQNASLYITGDSVKMSPPGADYEDIQLAARLAMSTGLVTGCLFQIPNERTIFAADPEKKSRSEDAVIAFTWDHFLNDPSKPEWLLRFPMIKASLRAMDTIKEFTAKSLPELNTQLDYFLVSGASKRGWTAWDVGAVDTKRVVAIVPIVLDAINFVAVMHHQFMSYGAWSFALGDYADMNIMSRIDHPNMVHLQEHVDPFFYRDRLTMPKLVVNAVLDEFQQPDDTRYWWADMPEPKHFLMTPNAEHSMATGIFEVVPAIAAFANSLLAKEASPSMTWEISNTTGEIVATLNEHGVVHEVNLWQAYSCGNNPDGKMRRDFRVAMLDNPCACGIYAEGICANLKSLWHKTAINGTVVRGKRTYSASVEAPTDGRWVAFFIEVTYEKSPREQQVYEQLVKKEQEQPAVAGPKGFIPPIPHDLYGRMMFTTEVSVWPNSFPFADCTGVSCGNSLC